MKKDKRQRSWVIYHTKTQKVMERVHSKYARKRRLAHWNNEASADAGEPYAPYAYHPAFGREQ